MTLCMAQKNQTEDRVAPGLHVILNLAPSVMEWKAWVLVSNNRLVSA